MQIALRQYFFGLGDHNGDYILVLLLRARRAAEVQKGESESQSLELCLRIGQTEAKLLRSKEETLEVQVKLGDWFLSIFASFEASSKLAPFELDILSHSSTKNILSVQEEALPLGWGFLLFDHPKRNLKTLGIDFVKRDPESECSDWWEQLSLGLEQQGKFSWTLFRKTITLCSVGNDRSEIESLCIASSLCWLLDLRRCSGSGPGGPTPRDFQCTNWLSLPRHSEDK